MRTHIKTYPIWHADIEVDDAKAYDLVVDSLCDYTARSYSLRFEIEVQDFLETLEDDFILSYIKSRAGRSESTKVNAEHIINRAKAEIKQNEVNVLIFMSVKEVTPVREQWTTERP